MNFDPRSRDLNTEFGLLVRSPALAEALHAQLQALIEVGAYKLLLQPDGQTLRWVTPEGRVLDGAEEPDTDPGSRLLLDLLEPFVPEGCSERWRTGMIRRPICAGFCQQINNLDRIGPAPPPSGLPCASTRSSSPASSPSAIPPPSRCRASASRRRPQRLRQVQHHGRGALGAGRSKASELRGESMQDVIFNGSGQRKPADAPASSWCSTTATRAPGAVNQFGEIAVKRVLTRDGGSSYYINNQPVRRRDVQDVFMGTGLGPRAYAIIGQGTISRIIESRPEELRLFLEEAAGVSSTRSAAARPRTGSGHAQNLTRVEDILRELNANLRSWRSRPKWRRPIASCRSRAR